MNKGTTFASELLALVYNATAIANIADNASSSPLTNIFFALHTASPGVSGNASTNEVSYTGYSRASAPRSTAGFTVSGSSVSLAQTVSFGTCTAGTATAMFWSSTTAASGTSRILHFGPIGSRLGPFTATASNDQLVLPGTSLAVDDRIVFRPTAGSSLPGGITEGTVYWVKTVSGSTITLSTTQGGATLDITGDGDGIAWRVTPLTISAGVTPQLGTSLSIVDA